MFTLIRERVSATGVIAVLALVFAMGGGAWAAKKYVITSTSQIKPSVLKKLKKKLKGKPGKQGATGSAGATGAAGPEGGQGAKGDPGPEGSPWTAGGTLPPGQTETGNWGVLLVEPGAAEWISLSFPIPLEESIDSGSNIHLIANAGEDEEDCPGTAEAPSAEPGHLCVYVYQNFFGIPEFTFTSSQVSGVSFLAEPESGEESAGATGTFAVTAETP